MIEDILRDIIRDEFNNFSKDIKKDTNKEKTSYYGRTVLTIKEAEAYLWRETAKSYAIEGNIYWQRILQRLEWEEKERGIAYEKALKRLEEFK
ncbi:hypothetical protein [Bacillus sp. J37]|uniref:hypothetical protein n=1 Tax=Bacillus sp. J37 TaxID=935837 RepID=UPI0004AE4198|nr:hypothetical protein [Bacillus sp. J37]